jgi:hypothetical protein
MIGVVFRDICLVYGVGFGFSPSLCLICANSDELLDLDLHGVSIPSRTDIDQRVFYRGLKGRGPNLYVIETSTIGEVTVTTRK